MLVKSTHSVEYSGKELLLVLLFPILILAAISACISSKTCCNLTSKQLSKGLVMGVVVLLVSTPPLLELVVDVDLLVNTEVSRLKEAEIAAVAPPCMLWEVPTNPDGKLYSGTWRGSSL